MTAKINFNSDQLEKLKVWFDINPNPGRVQVDHIASQIGALSAHVWIWFHRQRKRVEANPDVSPLKTKTTSHCGGPCSSLPNTDNLRTRSFSKRLECNSRRDQNVRKHGKETGDPKYRRQDRLRAKRGAIRGIQRKLDTRQRVGPRSAEGGLKGAVREVGRRHGMHVTFAEDVDVGKLQESELMQRLEPVQNCSERNVKVAESLEHSRLRSSPRKSTTRPPIGDHQELRDMKLCEEHMHREEKEPHYQGSARKSAPGSMSRIVEELDNQKSMRKKSVLGTEKKVLREADSQNLGIQMSTVRREKVESRENLRVRTNQDSFDKAEKVLEKKQRALPNFKKADHVKQSPPSDKPKTEVFPKKMDASGKITHGVHKRVIESEQKQKGIISSSGSIDKTTSRAERKNERQINVPVTKRKVTESLKSSKSEHHRAAELNLRHLKCHQPVTKMSSSTIRKVKDKSIKEKALLLAQKTNPLANQIKRGDVLKKPIETSEKPKLPVRKRRSREGLFSAISMPQAKAQVDLSDSSDAEDFQDDRHKKSHALRKKKMVTTGTIDSLNNGKSIPVLSGKRQNIALADCSNRVTAVRNLRRIPLESANQMHCANEKNKQAVSPVKCDVSSTVSSQSSVISSTVEESSIPQNCHKDISESLYLPDSNYIGKNKPCSLEEREIKQKKTDEEFGKKSGPVISDDKFWNPYKNGKFLFKRELSVNLIKINLSSISDQREVTVSSKMNPTNQLKENKEDNQLLKDDRTDINANVSENMSTLPKVAERSIWNSIASVETSSKVWHSIASSTEASPKEIPFIDGSSCLDKKSTELWSSIASSVEMSHKDIPFIERSLSPEGESTPSSSQDTVACNEGPSRANTKSMFDEDSCEVSSSVDLEKVPADLCEDLEGIEGIEETFSANLVGNNEDEEIVMENSEDNVESSEENTETMNKVNKVSAPEHEENVVEEQKKPTTDVISNKDKLDSSKVDLQESKETFGKTKLEFMGCRKETETSPNKIVKEFDETPVESRKPMETTERKLLKQERNTGEIKRTGILKEAPVECNKMSPNAMESSEISPDKENSSANEEPVSAIDDLYEIIDSPDYDIGSPFMVVDEIGGSDTEENKSNTSGSQEEYSEGLDSESISIKPFPEFVNKSPRSSEIIDLGDSDNDEDDEVILVSLTPPKKARMNPVGDKSLKDHSSSLNTSVRQELSADAFKTLVTRQRNCTTSKATVPNNPPEVIDLDCNSEDEVIQVSTVAQNTPNSNEIFIKETSDCSNVTEKQSMKSIQSDVPSVEVNGTSTHLPSVRHKQSNDQVVSESTETESSKPDAVLDMTCETVVTDSSDCGDHKTPEISNTSMLNNECNESLERKDSSSEELVIDMEACDKMDCPQPEQDVLTSLKDAVDDPVDQNVGRKDSSSDELVIDMEACQKMDCLQEDQGVPTFLEDSVDESEEQSVRHKDSLSNELVIDMTPCDKLNRHCPANGVSTPLELDDTASLNPSEPGVGRNDSSVDELVIDVEACEKVNSPIQDQVIPASSKGAGDPSKEGVECNDSKSDEFVKDIKVCDKMDYLQLDKGVLTSLEDAVNDPVEQSVGRKDSSSNELVIDMKPCDKLNRPCPDQGVSAPLEHDDAGSLNPSEPGVGRNDSSADELVIDMEACEKVNSPIQDQVIPASLKDVGDPSKESVECNDSKSDELVTDLKPCDKVNHPAPEHDAPLEHDDAAILSPSEQGVGRNDSSADELVIDMEACDKMEYLPKEQEAPEDDTCFPVDPLAVPSEDNIQHKLPDSGEHKPSYSADTRSRALEGLLKDKSDQVQQDAEMEASQKCVKVAKVCDELIGLLNSMDSPKRTVPTFSGIDSSQESNEVRDSTPTIGPVESSESENTPSGTNKTTSSGAFEDELDPDKQTLVHHDATSDDEVFIDVVTADPTECSLANTLLKKCVGTSLDILIPSAANTCVSVNNSESFVADVLDQGHMEGLVTNGLDQSVKKERPGNDSADQGEDEDPKTTKDCALSCDDSVAYGTAVSADRQGSSPVKAETICTELPECQEEGDSTCTDASASVADDQTLAVLSIDTPEKQLPENGIQIKSEPDTRADEDTPSGSIITHDGESKQANKENPPEKMRRPKNLNQLVSALAQRLGLLAKTVTPSPSGVDLPRSTVGINHKASHSKPSSSPPSTEGALQPPKPSNEPRRGSKRRMIINKNLKRPPIPEKVQKRIQQLNPYPCDHSWKHNAAVVELAQREVQLDCQPVEQVSLTGPPLEQLLDSRGSNSGNVNFYYQPGMDPVNAASRDTITEDSIGATATSSNEKSGSQPVSPQHSSSPLVESHPLLTGMLDGTEPLKRKRSRTASGNSKKGKKSRRRRRKSSDDVAWEISSRADALANGTFSEKDIREEWMQLLKVMEESTQSGTEEQPSISETVLPSSLVTASTSERLLGHQADGPVKGLPSASAQESDTSSMTETASEKEDLSGMPSILRVFSLRDEEQENTLALEPTGLGSFDLDSARIIETQGTSQVYSMAAAAAAATAARRHSQGSSDHTVPSHLVEQEAIRKRRSSLTQDSTDGVPPPKAVATGSNCPDRQLIQTNPIIAPRQVPSRVCNQSGNLPVTIQTIAASGASQNNYVLNSPLVSPLSSGMQNANFVLPSQPAPGFIRIHPKPLQQGQASQQRRGSLESLLNPLILNQQLQTFRLSASPPLCTPYPTTSVAAFRTLSGPSAPSGNIQNPGIGYLGGNIPIPTANIEWSEPPSNVQLAPVTTQAYTNGVDSQSTTFYTPQVSTVTFLTGSPQ